MTCESIRAPSFPIDHDRPNANRVMEEGLRAAECAALRIG